MLLGNSENVFVGHGGKPDDSVFDNGIGRTVGWADAAGAVTTTAYDSRFDQPSCITNALGNTTCYAYDIRGRKISEYGTAIQPAVFGYDEMDHMIRLTTFRVPGSVITTDPSSRTDGDTTSWTYDEATGLQLKKTYADNSQLVYTYDAMNRQSTQTLARGIVITYTYDLLTGDMTGISYGDTTPDYSFEYDRFGSIQSISQEGHSIPVEQRGYNEYNQLELECYFRGNDECYHIRHYDEYGRINFDTLQIVRNFMLAEIAYEITTEYNDLGQLSRYIYNLGQEDERAFQFNYLSGTHFVSSIDFPDPVSLEYTYEPVRDLLSGIMCRNSVENMISNRTQICDLLGRPTERTQIREGVTREDQFIYNSLNELTWANLGGTPFNYGYDNIGNRKDSEEFDKMTSYLSNNLNQYTSIDPEEEPAFIPTYDADGNQTRVRTTTGIWDVVYNAENRPVRFSSSDGTLVIECTYDYMGRRTHKILKRNDKLEFDEMYHYNGYLQTAAIRGTEMQHVILWNPSVSMATRPLAQVRNGNLYYAVHDFGKNITEWFSGVDTVMASFDYTPYGTIMNEIDDDLLLGCIGFSSEVMDRELDLVYYNYRYLNSMTGRWINRDYFEESDFYWNNFNLYAYICNMVGILYDYLGNSPYSGVPPVYNPSLWNDGGRYQHANNCYSYACDTRYDGDKIDPSKRDYNGDYKPQPGEESGYDPNKELDNCNDIIKRAKGDGLIETKKPKNCCPKNYHKVALVIGSYLNHDGKKGWDYHWYRQDQGGGWSHKPGSGTVRNTDDSGNPITNPETADRGMYNQFCAYMCATDM